jgi:hypothetical protein
MILSCFFELSCQTFKEDFKFRFGASFATIAPGLTPREIRSLVQLVQSC